MQALRVFRCLAQLLDRSHMTLWSGGVALLLAITACGGSREERVSQTSQLTDVDFPCYAYDGPSLARTSSEMPRGFLDTESFKVGSPRRVVNQLTGIPASYRNWLYRLTTTHGFRIAEQPKAQGVMGVTYFVNGMPTAIHITSLPDAVDFALQHEVGHAIHAKLRFEFPKFDQEFQKVFRAEAGHSRIRTYARSSMAEYFAESFANHYCSRDSHRFLATALPRTYRILRQYLAPAPWETVVQSRQPVSYGGAYR